MPGDSLEAHLEDAEMSGVPKGDIESMNVSEVIKELNKALNEASFFSKSRISYRNLRGIMKAEAFQDYLMHKYGFRLAVLDNLILNKLRHSLSIDGLGRKEIVDAIQKGTMKAEFKSGYDIADKLFGGGPR